MHEIPILVISCDKYSDLWKPFFSIFWQRWPDCPYPVYLGSNYKTYRDERVRPIPVGKDQSWAQGLRRMLDHLNTEYIILFLEDLLIQKQVDTEAIGKLVRIVRERQLRSLRLVPSKIFFAKTQRVVDLPDLGVLLPGESYRVSTEVTIWRVDTLRRLLLPGFTAWDFEYIGTKLGENMPDGFWTKYKPAIIYDHCVEKGKWRPEGLAICREAGVEVDLESRSAFTEEELKAHYLVDELKHQRYKIKSKAIDYFLNGQRMKGLEYAFKYLRNKPFSIQLWAVCVFGLTGPKAIAWLQREHLRLRVLRLSK